MREVGVIICVLLFIYLLYTDRVQSTKDHLIIRVDDSCLYMNQHLGGERYKLIKTPIPIKVKIGM